MPINFSVRWADNTADLKRNLAQGLDQIEVTRAAVDKLANSLIGTNVVKSANNWAAALQKVGGEAGALGAVQKLTSAEIERAIGVFDRAIAKADAMGQSDLALVQTYRELSAALHKASDDAEAATQTHKTFGDAVQGLGVSFTKLVAAQLTAQAILGTIEGGFRLLAGGISASVKAASEAEHAHVQVTAALKAQGNAVPSVVKAYLDYADALQQTTIFQDDAIEGAEALLVQVGNVMPRDMKKALTATTELASGLGKDLNEAAMLVAKAAEGNTAALKKAGVVIDETTAKSGDFGKVLDAITEKFGGQAAAIAGTYQGRLTQLGNTWNNVEESIGRVITQNATVLKFFDDMNQLIAINTHELKDNVTATNAVSDAVILAVRGTSLLASTLDTVQTGLSAFVIGARRGGQAIGNIGIVALEAAKGIALMQGDLAGFHVPDAAIASLKQAVNELGERNLVTTQHSVALGQALDTIGTRADALAKDLESTRGKTVELATATDTGADAWDKHTKAVEKTSEAQKKYAAALEEYRSAAEGAVSPTENYESVLDKVGNELYEGVAADHARGISTEVLAEIYQTTKTVIDQIIKSEAALAQQLDDTTNHMAASREEAVAAGAAITKAFAGQPTLLKNLLISTGALPISFHSILTPAQELGHVMTDITMSGKEHFDDLRDSITGDFTDITRTMRESGVQTRSDLQRTADLFLSEYKAMAASGQFTTDQLAAAWTRYRSAISAAKGDTSALSSVLGTLAGDFAQLSQISGDTFPVIAREIGGSVKAAQMFVDAMKAMKEASSASAMAGTAMDPKVLTNLALGWIGVAVTIYSVAKSLWDMKQAADEAHAATLWAAELKGYFHSDTLFSDQLAISIRKVADAMDPDAAAAWLKVFPGETAQAIASALSLSDIIKELGGVSHLSAQQLGDVKNSIHILLDLITAGGPRAVAAAKELDDVLMQMSDSEMKQGGIVDKYFLDTVKRAKQYGMELAGVSAFMETQANNAETGIGAALKVGNDAYAKRQDLLTQIAGLGTSDADKAKLADLKAQLDVQNKIIDTVGVHSQQAADAVSGSLLAVINSQILAGKSFHDSVVAIAPSVDALSQQMIAAGYNGSAAFDFLRGQVALVNDEVAGPALTAIEGYSAGLAGLNNAGLLNQDMFAGLTGQIGKTRDALVAQGKDPQAVMSAMRGSLQTMWELEEKFGYTTDDATQALIDQAKEQGIVGDKFKPIAEQQLDATNRIADAVEGLAAVFGILPKAAADAATGISNELAKIKTPTIKIPVWTEDQGLPAGTIVGAQGFATGTDGLRDFGTGTLAVLHGREAVVTEAQVRAASTVTTGSSASPVAPAALGGDLSITVQIDSLPLTKAVVKDFRRNPQGVGSEARAALGVATWS